MYKKCLKCHKNKELEEFCKNKGGKEGRHSICKECRNKTNRDWRRDNVAWIRDYRKRYRQKYKEKVARDNKKWHEENKEHCVQYRKDNKKIRNRYNRKWYKKESRVNPKFRLDGGIGRTIWYALKGKKAGRKWEKLVGYTLNDLVKHLESQFEDWMSWENYGKWEVDHIKPKSLFKYETAEDESFKECWALRNLQPLEKIANRRKSNKYENK